ncbi:MAG TPA: aldo/keto reductase [Acidobacteriaceae bacterium]|nr:aldo/keto reductase [Acidobacteriaceae bacterium]
MEYRYLGKSGLRVPELCFGCGTFGGNDEFFDAWGATQDINAARKMVDICMEAGLNFFDTADIYSFGRSETVLGKAIDHLKREDVLISTKATFRYGQGINDVGSSRHHLIRALEGSLQRLGTDYVDVYHMHEIDSMTPVEETLSTLDTFVRSGKVRYIACSNYTGWLLMKSLSVSERYGWSRFVGHQVYYSLVGREYEWELMPLALDQGVGALIWSPLGWGRLTGKIRRSTGIPAESRLNSKLVVDSGPQVPEEYLYKVVDALDEVAAETGKTVPQIALNWLLRRPTVSTLVIGARNEQQLRQNLGATGWSLTPQQVARLDAASDLPLGYPYWHNRQFEERNPKLF